MQPYSAFNNNPIRYNDPTGMIAEEGDPGKKSWLSRAWGEVKSWFSSGDGYTSIPSKTASVEVGPGYFEPYEELQTGSSWYSNGVTSTVVNSTTVVNQPNVGTPFYSFIYPNNLGSWGQTGSDGKVWIGCMSCHGQNGAYTYASHNSQENLAGQFFASIFNLALGSSIGGNSNSSSMRVGQHMTADEFTSFSATGRIPRGNVLHNNPNGFSDINLTHYAEFDVNPNILKLKDANKGWHTVLPNTAIYQKLYQSKGMQMPHRAFAFKNLDKPIKTVIFVE